MNEDVATQTMRELYQFGVNLMERGEHIVGFSLASDIVGSPDELVGALDDQSAVLTEVLGMIEDRIAQGRFGPFYADLRQDELSVAAICRIRTLRGKTTSAELDLVHNKAWHRTGEVQ